MRAGQGFSRWGFILGNVLIAFGAPVFVTSLVATVAGGRTGPATGQADGVVIVAGAVFMIVGLVVAVVAGRHRPAPQPGPEREYPHMVVPVEPKSARPTEPRPIEPLPLTLNTLDDYYAQPDRAQPDRPDEAPPFSHRPVPRPRNARGWVSGDRFCEPSATVTRSNGIRRRPQAG